VTEADNICGDDSIGVFGQDLVALVVVEGRSQMKAFRGAEVSGAADGSFVVDEDIASRGV
jgi:hypothetical protein